METSILINSILLIIYWISVSCEGYMDGYLKKTGKMLHGLKLGSHGGLLVITFIALYFNYLFISPLIVLPFLVSRKPFFDYAWTLGYGNKGMPYIGNTSITDKVIRWMRLPELEVKFRFPFIGLIYLSLIFLSVVLAIEIGK